MPLPNAPLVPYHLTGFGVWLTSTGVIGGELTAAQLEDLNTEDATNHDPPTSADGSWCSLVFPAIDLAGFVGMRTSSFNSRIPEYSLDTTNGSDGTWTDIPGTHQVVTDAALFRDALLVIDPPIVGVKGVRWGTESGNPSSNNYLLGHVYGFSTEPEARLELWHPTLDQRLTSLDAGVLNRGVTQHDTTFRIKNTSAIRTANTITVQTDESKVWTPSVPSWHTLSDGGAFGATASIASLAPGAISGVLTLRREPPVGVEIGYKRAWLRAVATDWS